MEIILLILGIMFGPPVIFTILGTKQSDKNKSKFYYILAVGYLVIGLGVCGAIINSF